MALANEKFIRAVRYPPVAAEKQILQNKKRGG